MLPQVSARWMAEILERPIPEEHQAACDRCVMQLSSGDEAERGATYFTEGKCCTYQPQLHAFLVGGILIDPDRELTAARETLHALIDGGAGASPLGVLGARSYWHLYNTAVGFGVSKRLRCPFFDVASGSCSIWRHREATCATWFCKHDRGALGEAFWSAARRLLQLLESSVSRWCALELDVGDEALGALSELESQALDAEDLDGRANPQRRARIWGRWAGREDDYYAECARRVEKLTVREVLAIGGVEARLRARVIEQRLAALSHEFPVAPLRVGRFEVVVVAHGDVVRTRGYRAFDPLDVPAALLPALARFDGRPTAEVVEEIAKRDGLDLSETLLRTLLDFGVLVAEGG